MSESLIVPKHIGIILDGNRRWAKANGLPSLDGHRRGAEVFKEITLAMFERGIQYVSAFVFSTENWSRKTEEIGYLMKLVVVATNKYLDEFHRANIKVIVLGNRDDLSKAVRKCVEKVEDKTKSNTGGTLILCFNYGGQQEIVEVTKRFITEGVDPETITPEKFDEYLQFPEVPALDLVIRTSGEQRLSGFMLYRAAYAELLFMNKYWPEFNLADIDYVLTEYTKRERRFGK